MKQSLAWSAVAATVAVVFGLGAISAFAQQSLEAAVKQRQDAMNSNGEDLWKTINDYLQGKGGYQATAVAKARDLLVVADKIGSLFPPGTSSADMVKKTRAKPEIWTQMDKFNALIGTLKAEETKLLAALQKGDMAASKAAYKSVDDNACGACHDLFRGPRIQ